MGLRRPGWHVGPGAFGVWLLETGEWGVTRDGGTYYGENRAKPRRFVDERLPTELQEMRIGDRGSLEYRMRFRDGEDWKSVPEALAASLYRLGVTR